MKIQAVTATVAVITVAAIVLAGCLVRFWSSYQLIIREARAGALPLGQLAQLHLLICCPLLLRLATALSKDGLCLDDPAAYELLANGYYALICQPNLLHVLPKGRHLYV